MTISPHLGATEFDLADRLAIINLCNSYSDLYDAGNLNQWWSLFVENPSCTICLGKTEPVKV